MNSKPKITAISIAAIVAMSIVASSIQAQPSDEINRAVKASGAPSVSQAAPDVFVHAFSSVVVRARGKDVSAYVAAGISMRPDLAPQITVAALRAYRPRGKEIAEKQKQQAIARGQVPPEAPASCDWVDPIIRTAIAAAPSAKTAIVLAAIDAQPYARQCILAAAGLSDKDLRLAYTRRSDGKEVINAKEGKEVVPPCPECPETAWLRPPGIDVGNVNSSIVGTINPANLGQGGIVSPERRDP